MPNEPLSPRKVRFTSEFKRNLRHLAKKYRHIKSDVQPVLGQLSGGAAPGDRISGVAYEVYKVRIKNSDASRGKSGGYRSLAQRVEALERAINLKLTPPRQKDWRRVVGMFGDSDRSYAPLRGMTSLAGRASRA